AAICRRLAAAGVRVAVADLDVDGGTAVADEVGGLFVPTDVTERAQLDRAVAAAVERFGRLDLAALNAGVSSAARSGLDPFDERWYRRIVGINLDGVVFGVAAVLPALRRCGGGSIVATASLAGLVPMPADAFYTMTKTAVVGLVRALAEPLAAYQVRINALCPGFADTPLVAGAKELFVRANFPLLDADDVAAAFQTVADDPGSGQAWFVQPGREPAPYRFHGVPGPLVDGASAPRPPSRIGGPDT
ncbi:MAG TPA: SDR family NAD(P)-dependent oxidoreductase, partial [Mycobacteriales bacterium]|nr:SDR family NAD(P)-dependent oxidoreductase [Mycobacteriales bacterium]